MGHESKPTVHSRTRGTIVADAMIAEMNAAKWIQAFTAQRYYVAPLDKDATKVMRVLVQVNDTEDIRINRMYRQLTHAITIALRRLTDPKVIAAVDTLAKLMQDIADFYRVPRGRHKIAGTNAYVVDVREMAPDPSELEFNMQFFAALNLAVVELVSEP